MTHPTVIRASSLNGYPDCGRRGAASLFRKIIEDAGFKLRDMPRGIGATIGTALHRSAALVLAEKARTGALPPESVMADAARDSFTNSVREGVRWDRETPGPDQAQQQLIRQARSYLREIAPKIEPIMVEERLEAQVTEHLVLSGQPDTVARESGGRVRDLKSGKRRQNCKPQLGAYSLLARSNKLDIAALVEDVVPRTALSKPQPPSQSFYHEVAGAETAAIRILSEMEADLRAFTEGDERRRIVSGDPWAFTANPSSMICGEKYCSAWGTEFCKEWMNRDA